MIRSFRFGRCCAELPPRQSSFSQWGTCFFLFIIVTLRPLSAQDNLLPVFHFNRLSTDDGLSTNEIRSRVIRDNRGFVWVGTQNGLERYDGYGFKDYRNVPNDPYSLSSNSVLFLLLDSKERLWVGTYETGLSLYDAAHDRFLNFSPTLSDSSGLQAKTIDVILEDPAGNIWVGARFCGVLRLEIPPRVASHDLDSLARTIRFTRFPLGTPRNSANDLCLRDDGTILVASDRGVLILDPTTQAVTRAHLADPLGRRLDSLHVWSLTRDRNGSFWVGTGTEGMFKLDFDDGTVLNYRHRKGDGTSIGSDSIMEIVEDTRGNLWLNTVVGIDLFSPVVGRCTPYLAYGRAPRLSGLSTLLSVDRTGTVWLGTNTDGLFWLSRKSERFPNYAIRNTDGSLRSFENIERNHDGTFWFSSAGALFQIDIATQRILKTIDVFRGRKPTTSIPDNTSTVLDGSGHLWYGTWGLGLYRVDCATGQISNYRYESSFGDHPRVLSMVLGGGDSIWTASWWHGLMKFNTSSGKFLRFPIANLEAPFHVMKDREGKIWISSELNGVFVYDPEYGTTARCVHDPSNPRSLSRDRTRNTYQDPAGRIWVAAGNVVNLWDAATKSFTRYPNDAFKQSPLATLVGSDRKGRLWVTFGSGLSMLDPSSGQYTNFDASDGVCAHVVDMENLQDGRVLFSGSGGMNIVDPDSIQLHRPAPPLVITQMRINDEPVVAPSLLDESGTLQLTHAQDVLEFEFAAIDIDAPQLVEYQYQLEGLEKDWVRPEGRRFVRYAGLPPGDYVFKVRAATSRGEWPEQEIALAVSIAPPWWQARWAYATYVLLFVGLLYSAYRVRLRQVRLQQEVELGRFKAEHLAEVDRLKSRFFANISHEFRTPLTLILGPIQKWQSRSHEEDEKKDLRMAEGNAHRLLRLINQVLDLSKLEAGALKLRASRMNIVPLVRGIAYSFESSAGIGGIALNVYVDEEEIELYCDKDMVEKILSNLLSNAFTFTPKGGKVEVHLHLSDAPPRLMTDLKERESVRMGEWVTITVSDTGIGIPTDQLDKIFDRFYQVDASQTREHGGSGLGLALVKELVELHHGTIQVQSDVGQGTSFTVRLPLGRSHLKDDEVVETPLSADLAMRNGEDAPVDTIAAAAPEEREPELAREEKPIVLVVEDNADVRAYIKDYLTPVYEVAEARDGIEGIIKAGEIIPDLVISDVMMPKKNGYEVCRTLKLDEKTCHIPVILLTAKAASEDKVEGLEIGADDYLIKPFEPKELTARVKNLIELRRTLRRRFSKSVSLKPGEIAVTSIDDAFLRKVATVVEQRMGDENLSVEELSQEVGMSRSQLHRKLTALTNLSPSDFIRHMRLQRAMALLQGNAGTVAEIAYAVGFGDPSHFSRRFHEVFGITPGDVRKAPR